MLCVWGPFNPQNNDVSLGDRASELIDDLVPKRVKLGLNPGCILKFLACSIRGQDRLISGTRRADPASISDFAT